MYLREQRPRRNPGGAFKDATPDRPSPTSSARRKNNKSKSLASIPFPDGESSNPKGAPMASRDHFQQELNAQIERAIEHGAEQLIVNSGELLAAVRGRPGLKQ
jgi:hypothetical protein